MVRGDVPHDSELLEPSGEGMVRHSFPPLKRPESVEIHVYPKFLRDCILIARGHAVEEHRDIREVENVDRYPDRDDATVPLGVMTDERRNPCGAIDARASFREPASVVETLTEDRQVLVGEKDVSGEKRSVRTGSPRPSRLRTR